MTTTTAQLEALAKLITEHQQEDLRRSKLDCQSNLDNAVSHFSIGKKYARVDVGRSGKYMVEMETGKIYGIKAYGVIHRGHQYGTMETINEFYWGRYTAGRKAATNAQA